MRETPTITASTYSATAYTIPETVATGANNAPFFDHGIVTRRVQVQPDCTFGGPRLGPEAQQEEERIFKHLERLQQMTARVVRVFIFDPNENLNLESRMIYRSQEKLTDLTDQELFFELPMAELLGKHNELRAKTVNKVESSKLGKEVYLDPVRIRDLKMSVLSITSF